MGLNNECLKVGHTYFFLSKAVLCNFFTPVAVPQTTYRAKNKPGRYTKKSLFIRIIFTFT